MASPPRDLRGEKFGRLTPVERIIRPYTDPHGKQWNITYWRCICDCGKESVTQQCGLVTGRIVSCGCFSREKHYLRTHELSKHPLYRRWSSTKQRCYNPNDRRYEDYGGRGIYVCEEWLHDFMAFYNWSIENGWKEGKGLSLDRIDNDGPYAPWNCRWATRVQQQNNKRNTLRFELDGESHTAAEWSKISGLRLNVIQNRIYAGWDPKDIISTPVGARRKGANAPKKV